MSSSPSPRLVSLDAFRGATIAGMLLVNNPGSWSDLYPPLAHAPWHGWTFTDTIFPSFLWIVGVAMTLSFARRVEAGGEGRAREGDHQLVGVGMGGAEGDPQPRRAVGHGGRADGRDEQALSEQLGRGGDGHERAAQVVPDGAEHVPARKCNCFQLAPPRHGKTPSERIYQ